MTAPQPRYFFPVIRAHHAFCMAVDFGMKFCNSRGETLLLDAIKRDSQYERFYVHPESLHLLEPQISDVVKYWITYKPDYYSSSTAERTKEHFKRVNKAVLFQLKHKQGVSRMQIVQRNGIAFHWPERET